MTRLLHVALELQRFLDEKSWRNCVIGGIAVQRWGEPRLTQDVDLSLLTGFGEEEGYVEALLARYKPRLERALQFALERRVVLVQTGEGIGIDIALAAMPFEESAINRSSLFEFASGVQLRTCSAEDLVVMKAIAGRDQDWLDIKGVLIRQGSKLNWQVILTELTPLCELKESLDTVSQLERLRERIRRA